VGRDVLDRAVHRVEVGRAVVGERGRDADDDSGGPGDDLGSVDHLEALLQHRADLGIGDVVHV
jgi:hypothetical protein